MGKFQRANFEFDRRGYGKFTDFSEFMDICGIRLLHQIAIVITFAMALLIGLFIFFG